jgi:hypothetical protein
MLSNKEFQAVAMKRRWENDALVKDGEDLAVKAGLLIPGGTPTYPGQPSVAGSFTAMPG